MKKFLPIVCVMLVGVCFCTSEAAYSGEFLAGTAEVDITAPIGYPMGGYGARKEGAKGIHDPLIARVVLFKTEDVSLALVAVDLVLFFSERILSEAKEKWNVDHVILSCTHTHAGPIPKAKGLLDLAEYSKDPENLVDMDAISEDPWHRSTEDKIIAAIGEAQRNLFPAQIGAGKGSIQLGHNRRLVEKDGTVRMIWNNLERIPTSPVDPTVGVIRIDDESGTVRALLVNYACHAVVLGSENQYFSADFPGYMVKHIEEEFGEQCMGMFLQGASGDIDPFDCVKPGTDEGYRVVEETGRALGKEAVRVAQRITTGQNKNASVKVKKSVTAFSHRNEPEKISKVGVVTAVINDEIALVGLPGEPFVQHQIDLMKRSHIDNTFLLGLAYFGEGIPFTLYLPTIEAAIEGGYGADDTTFLEVGAGERLIDMAVISIYELLGMLSDIPSDVQ